MCGANQLVAEAGGVNLFLQNLTHDGVMVLSPLGQVAKAFSSFASGRAERGIPYAPIAIVLERAHGFGVGLTALWRGKPTTWNGLFDLTGPEEVAWELLQELWPGSWFHQAMGTGAASGDEIDYQTPSPFGDSFDFLLEHGDVGAALAASRYSVAVMAGEVELGDAAIARLLPWVKDGRTAVIFASQLLRASTAAAESIMGAQLTPGGPTASPRLLSALDEETGWGHDRSAPAPSPFAPPPPPHQNGHA